MRQGSCARHADTMLCHSYTIILNHLSPTSTCVNCTMEAEKGPFHSSITNELLSFHPRTSIFPFSILQYILLYCYPTILHKESFPVYLVSSQKSTVATRSRREKITWGLCTPLPTLEAFSKKKKSALTHSNVEIASGFTEEKKMTQNREIA